VTSRQVKDRLRGRHPATQTMGTRVVPGAWTVIEEPFAIDVLAISANAHPASGSQRGARYARVGYEVKVSRSDMRAELLDPGKRALAVAMCHEFYFAAPAGLLRDNELSFVEPAHFADYSSFVGVNCPAGCVRVSSPRRPGRRRRGRYCVSYFSDEPCPTCDGTGFAEKSRVEREAPHLWIPADVGLVEVSEGGRLRVRKPAPVRAARQLDDKEVGLLIRWASVRPDQRHEAFHGRTNVAVDPPVEDRQAPVGSSA
jgi:hypothetical protein